MVKVDCHCCGKHESSVQLFTCAKCISVSYCSRECQRQDWTDGCHKQICGYLAKGDAKQICTLGHTIWGEVRNEFVETSSDAMTFTEKKFFKIFQESSKKSPEAQKAAAREMKRILFRTPKESKIIIFYKSIGIMVHDTPTEMLNLPTCPMNVFFPGLDPDAVLSGLIGSRAPALQWLAASSDHSDERTTANSLILAKKLIAAGANVNGRDSRHGTRTTALHMACGPRTPTNLDFVKLLLKRGANPNAPDSDGLTPLHLAVATSPMAAKFMLEYAKDKIDINAISHGNPGFSALALLRRGMFILSMNVLWTFSEEACAPWSHPFHQMKEVENILVTRGAVDVGSDSETLAEYGRQNLDYLGDKEFLSLRSD